MDTSLLRTVCFVPGEKSPYFFSKFNPLIMDTPLIQTLSMPPLPPPPTVSVLLQCDYFHRCHLNKIDQLNDRKVAIPSETVVNHGLQPWSCDQIASFWWKKRLTSDVFLFGHIIQNHSSCSCGFCTVCPIWAGLNHVALFGSERACWCWIVACRRLWPVFVSGCRQFEFQTV